MDYELLFKIYRKLFKILVPLLFITAIIVVIAGSAYKYYEIDFKSNAMKTSAEIMGFTEYGYPVLLYSVEGKEYKIRSRSQIPNSVVGKKVEIEYHRYNPTDVQIGENPIYKISVPMIVFGSLGALATGYFLFLRIFKVRSI